MSADSHLVACDSFIGANRLAVPTHCFKAILLWDAEGNYSMYAFLMPNVHPHILSDPSEYVIRVDELEEITGYDFFRTLNDSIENSLGNISAYYD
jgi:endonuclease G